MAHLTQRRLTSEMMDDPNADPIELARALGFIRFVNRRCPLGLGGADATISHLKRFAQGWSKSEEIRILDIGTGSADIPLSILRWADHSGWTIHITAIDLHARTIATAREQVAASGEEDRITLLELDALKLADYFEPSSFHYAHAAMFLHHLSDIEVMTVLRVMDRLSRWGVLWNDLVRSGLTRAAVRGMSFFVPPMARHDAIVSFDAGFTKSEAIDLARRAGLEHFRWQRHLLYRFTLISEKRD